MPCWPGCRGLTTVFYDGKCGLCSKEINHYMKIAPKGRIIFVMKFYKIM